LYFLLL